MPESGQDFPLTADLALDGSGLELSLPAAELDNATLEKWTFKGVGDLLSGPAGPTGSLQAAFDGSGLKLTARNGGIELAQDQLRLGGNYRIESGQRLAGDVTLDGAGIRAGAAAVGIETAAISELSYEGRVDGQIGEAPEGAVDGTPDAQGVGSRVAGKRYPASHDRRHVLARPQRFGPKL